MESMSRGGVGGSTEAMAARKEASDKAERQHYIDRVYIAALTGTAVRNSPDFVLERAYNLAEEAWKLRQDRRGETE